MINETKRLRAKDIVWVDKSQWYNMPKQTRSRETMMRIYDAAVALFAEKGYDLTTTADIAKAAGVTTGSIYRRFPDKEALLYTIVEAYSKSRVPELIRLCESERWADRSAAEIVEFYIDMLFSSYRTDRQMIRIIERRSLADEKMFRVTEDWNILVAESFTKLLRPHSGEIRHRHLKTAMEHLHAVIRSTMVQLALHDGKGRSRSTSLDSNSLKASILDMALAYLGLERSKKRRKPPQPAGA